MLSLDDDAAGNLLGYQTTTQARPYLGGGSDEKYTNIATTTYQYGHNGGYQQARSATTRSHFKNLDLAQVAAQNAAAGTIYTFSSAGVEFASPRVLGTPLNRFRLQN